jgi:hypothetical protein
MIACDDKQCDIEWYHKACLPAGTIFPANPMVSWYCPTCTSSEAKALPALSTVLADSPKLHPKAEKSDNMVNNNTTSTIFFLYYSNDSLAPLLPLGLVVMKWKLMTSWYNNYLHYIFTYYR